MTTAAHDSDLSDRTRSLLLEADHADVRRRQSIFDEVVTSHLWLARALARRFRVAPGDEEDVLQVARSGLVEATRRFNPDAGDFVSFAAPTILGTVKRHFRDHGWLVRPPRHLQEVATAVRRTQPYLMQELGAEPTDADLSEVLGESVDLIRQARSAGGGYAAVSLDNLTQQSSFTDEKDDQHRNRAEAEMMISKLLAGLSIEQQRLLRLRFVEQRSQTDIATELGTNQMRVSRTLAALLRQLRARLGEIEPPTAA